ncbi:MAG: thiamine diphosphokinase [Dictyoglomaceae bacterium]
MKILIFANGENHLEFSDIEDILPIDKIICADGGTKKALELGLLPNIIVGDLDSFPKEIGEKLVSSKIEWKIYPKEKDKTYLELAVREALNYNPEVIYFIGLLGGRIDHLLANLFFLERIKENRIEILVIDKNIRISIMKGQEEKSFFGDKGDLISLIPFSEVVEGISSEGLKYPLYNESLYRNLTRGISNEFTQNIAQIKIKSGTLLIIHFIKK